MPHLRDRPTGEPAGLRVEATGRPMPRRSTERRAARRRPGLAGDPIGPCLAHGLGLRLAPWLALAAALLAPFAPAAAQFAPLGRSADGHYTLLLETPSGPLRLALDTGAQGSAITLAAAERLGLPPAPGARLITLAGSAMAERRHLAQAKLGALVLPPLSPVVLAQAPDSAGRLDGFLGLDAFAGEILRIDLHAMRLGRDKAPACLAQPGLPETDGLVHGVAVRVRIDTGLAGSVGEPRLGAALRARGARDRGRARLTAADGSLASARRLQVRRLAIDRHRLPGPVEIAIADLPVFARGPGDAGQSGKRPLTLIAGADLLEGAVLRLAVGPTGACARVEAP